MSSQSDPLIQKLIEKLRDSDPRTRRNAAGALRMQGSRAATATTALLALLDDANPLVRQEAQRALDHLRMVRV
jgi:HEAT repeat protein